MPNFFFLLRTVQGTEIGTGVPTTESLDPERKHKGRRFRFRKDDVVQLKPFTFVNKINPFYFGLLLVNRLLLLFFGKCIKTYIEFSLV